MRKIGAPKGGRVHWLLHHLPSEFKGAYELYYSYHVHNYTFVRHSGKQIFDVFIVKQTSLHYWRVAYSNPSKGIFEFFGYKNTKIIAEYMYELYLEFRT